jgi:hypothetical protein
MAFQISLKGDPLHWPEPHTASSGCLAFFGTRAPGPVEESGVVTLAQCARRGRQGPQITARTKLGRKDRQRRCGNTFAALHMSEVMCNDSRTRC